MTNTPADVNALFADFGSTNKADLRVSKKEYSATSVTTMAERIVARIQQTIVAIEQFDSWDKPIKAAPLTAPMATRELGGFTVKIGTGAKNEAFGIAARHFKMSACGHIYFIVLLLCLAVMDFGSQHCCFLSSVILVCHFGSSLVKTLRFAFGKGVALPVGYVADLSPPATLCVEDSVSRELG